MDFQLEIDLVSVMRNLLADVDASVEDKSIILRRLRAEGTSFVTKTLPKIAKAMLLGLELGSFPSKSELSNFRYKGGLPRLLRGFLLGIFDHRGRLLKQPCSVCIYAVRQVCEYVYKLALPFDESELAKAEADFVKTDNEVVNVNTDNRSFLEAVRRNIEREYRFPELSEVLRDHRPRNGPGTFSSENAKVDPAYYKSSCLGNTHIPSGYMGISGFYKSYPGSPERISSGEDTSTTSEVLFVPKDSRGPRTIVREPQKALMLQMSYFDWLSSFLESETCKRVNFVDQEINRELARKGSENGRWATIDLKEASDRVSTDVVTHIFRYIPVMRWFLNQRTTHTKLPSGGIIPLKKLAGMGSGLTFATMSFLIHASIATNASRRLGISYTNASRKVYVYGDDIIVPSTWVSITYEALQLVGLRANKLKSFTNLNSRFRESCGGDYYEGDEVEPLRLKLSGGVERKTLTTVVTSSDASVIQLERHCRNLVACGMFNLVHFYYRILEKRLGKLPIVNQESVALGQIGHVVESYDCAGNVKKVSAWVPRAKVKVHDQPNPWHFVGKSLSSLARDGDLFDYEHATDGYKFSTRGAALHQRKVYVFVGPVKS